MKKVGAFSQAAQKSSLQPCDLVVVLDMKKSAFPPALYLIVPAPNAMPMAHDCWPRPQREKVREGGRDKQQKEGTWPMTHAPPD